MSHALIPVFAGELAGIPVQLVDARLLHRFLQVGKRYASWIVERIAEYGFVQDQDFLISQNRETKPGRGGDRRSKDYHITLDMAKELAMVERNDKGREARRYFIECERQLRNSNYGLRELPSAEAIARALESDLRTHLIEAMPAPERTAPAIHPNYAYAREQYDSLMDWGRRALPRRVQAEFFVVMEELNRSLVRGWTEIDEACLHLAVATSMLKRWRNPS